MHLLATYQPLHPFVDDSLARLLTFVLIAVLLDLPQLPNVPVNVGVGTSISVLAPTEMVSHARREEFKSCWTEKRPRKSVLRRLLAVWDQIEDLVQLIA